LRRDDLVRATLGTHLLDRFVEAKTMEWQEYNRQVSAWELERYLSIY
jgi:glutamine synthetase